MQHAEAQQRLTDLALEPGRLARLEDDRSPDGLALSAHVATCDRCSAELAGWRRTWTQVGAGLAATADDVSLGPIRAPAAMRERTMAAVAAEGRARPGAGGAPAVRSRRLRLGRRPSLPWLAAAAALIVAIGAGSLAWARSGDLDRARSENAALTATTASLDRVLATPAHWVVTLREPGGTAGGTVAWTASELVVITTGLATPSVGQTYRCWVERDGVRTPIGSMAFSGSTGYWTGSMAGWAADFAPGARFGVSVVADGGGGATPVLTGAL